MPERKPDPLSEEARRLSTARWVLPPPDELDNPGWNLNRARQVLVELVERLERAEAERERAVYLAKNLLGMIPQQVWRDQGGDDGQGHYEGDYYAEQVATELEALAANPIPESHRSNPPRNRGEGAAVYGPTPVGSGR